jgi:hypothetical protein
MIQSFHLISSTNCIFHSFFIIQYNRGKIGNQSWEKVKEKKAQHFQFSEMLLLYSGGCNWIPSFSGCLFDCEPIFDFADAYPAAARFVFASSSIIF